MNIIRAPKPPKRRHNITVSANPTELIIDKPSGKKALLIGINKTLMDGGSGKRDANLNMPHKDVQAMRTLLIEKYQYHPNDVVSLVDIDDPKQPQPTMENILREMKNLVADARRGDRFFFHYSGHVVQKDNLDHTEEDGKDECLVPCDSDGVNNIIMDDTLRDILVDRLPLGSHLVAVLDSCHSGSLLDLEHYRCNRVWVPWESKGRRKSASMMNNVRRQPALVVIQNKRISADRVKQRKTTVPMVPQSPVPPLHSRTSSSHPRPHLSRAASSATVPTAPASPVASPQKKLARALTMNAGKSISALKRNSTTWMSGKNPSQQTKTRSSKTVKSQFTPWLDMSQVGNGNERGVEEGSYEGADELGQQCESPIQQYCSGWCHTPHSPAGLRSPNSPTSPGAPEIISLASCKDSQEAWEDKEGHSMTQMLVEILKQDPHPTLTDLMVTVSHKLHNAALGAHSKTKQYKRQVVRYRKKHPENTVLSKGGGPWPEGDTFGLNMNDFQDPQLSSRKPLNMAKRWNL